MGMIECIGSIVTIIGTVVTVVIAVVHLFFYKKFNAQIHLKQLEVLNYVVKKLTEMGRLDRDFMRPNLDDHATILRQLEVDRHTLDELYHNLVVYGKPQSSRIMNDLIKKVSDHSKSIASADSVTNAVSKRRVLLDEITSARDQLLELIAQEKGKKSKR